MSVRLEVIKTQGDKILDVALAKVGGKGLFVKEIEDALLAGRAHLAVHSMKDVPAELPPGLILAGVSAREDPRDVLITRPAGGGLDDLPANPKVGTSSLRRAAQLMALRPDASIVTLRGNVETRLRKLTEQQLDAIVLAAAGLNRLGLMLPEYRPLDAGQMLPAVGQGALGLECREDDQDTRSLAQALSHADTGQAVAAERAFLARLEGGCQVPIAGYATVEDGVLFFNGLVADLQGKNLILRKAQGNPKDAAEIGREIANQVLEAGGREILREVYGELEQGG
jgi:hydroxymethylbilane synthase